MGDLFERYSAVRAPQMRAWHDVNSVWANWAEARLAHVRLSDLTIHHGLDLRDHVAAHSSPLRAASVIRYLRPMFAWAADERIIDANPWATLKAREKAPARERVLSLSEWAMLWNADGLEPYPFGPFLRALMLSGQRLSNVAGMRWDAIRGDVWVIPREEVKATRTQNAAAHEVPLSGALAALIAEQPCLGPFVFTTRRDRPITPGSRQKDRFQALANDEAAKVKGQPLEAKEMLTDWRFHDLRRTGATLMTHGGISRFIVERVLGHADRGVTAIYDRNLYREEKRAALEVLAATVAPSAHDGPAFPQLSG